MSWYEVILSSEQATEGVSEKSRVTLKNFLSRLENLQRWSYFVIPSPYLNSQCTSHQPPHNIVPTLLPPTLAMRAKNRMPAK